MTNLRSEPDPTLALWQDRGAGQPWCVVTRARGMITAVHSRWATEVEAMAALDETSRWIGDRATVNRRGAA